MEIMNKFKFNKVLMTRLPRCGEGEDDVAEGSEDKAPAIDINSDSFKSAVAAAASSLVATETDGLKNKNSDLIERLQKAKDTAKQFEGMDIEKIRTMTKIFEQSEEAQMIADGKFDEVMQKRTDKVTSGFNDQVQELTLELERSLEKETSYKTRLDQNSIRDELTKAALKAGVRKDAIEDIVRRGFDTFSISDSEEVEARDRNGELALTDDKLILNPERFVESLKSTNSYYWSESESGGTSGSNDRLGGKNSESVVSGIASSADFNLADYRKARSKQSGEDYHQRNK